MNRTLDGKLMDDIAIERIRAFADNAVEMHPDGYYVANSGGKDSTVIVDLVKRAGVKATYHHNLTTADAPETIYYLRDHHPDTQIRRPPMTMWQVIVQKGMPPRRAARYCCQTQKETGGPGRFVVLGVRWAESNRRSKRKMVEQCLRDVRRRFLNPIIDWTTADVWQYIRERNLPYNRLYDEGFRRVGCVLCPMIRDTQRDIERWPRIAAAWERAIKATWKPSPDKRHQFPNPEALWQWWLDRDATIGEYAECMMLEDDPGLFDAAALGGGEQSQVEGARR